MSEMDFWRQLDIFSPFQFEKPVHIIGVGAIGSYIAETLAKMGVEKIFVYDPDVVEIHNLPNQIYGPEDEGKKKVEALASHLRKACGIEITAMDVELGEKEHNFSGIVFLCVDSMAARKQIWERYLKLNINVDLLVEVRMGAEIGRIYTIKPFNYLDVESWEKTLYSDEEAEESPCTARAISSTIKVIAGIATHKLTKFQRGISYQKEVIVSLNPLLVTTRSW